MPIWSQPTSLAPPPTVPLAFSSDILPALYTYFPLYLEFSSLFIREILPHSSRTCLNVTSYSMEPRQFAKSWTCRGWVCWKALNERQQSTPCRKGLKRSLAPSEDRVWLALPESPSKYLSRWLEQQRWVRQAPAIRERNTDAETRVARDTCPRAFPLW